MHQTGSDKTDTTRPAVSGEVNTTTAKIINGTTDGGTKMTDAPPSSSISSAATVSDDADNLHKIPLQKLPELVERLTDVLEHGMSTHFDMGQALSSAERVRCLRQRAQCHFRLHEHRDALRDAEEALQENPGDVDSYIVAGQASAGLGEFKEAFQFYKIALQLDPKNKMLTEQLRQLQERILQHSEVAEEGEPTYNALDFSTQDPYPGDDVQLKLEREILLGKYKVLDHVPGSVDGVKRGKDTSTAQAEAVKYLQLAFEAISTGRYQDAVACCTRALTAEPTNVFALKFRGQLYFDNHQMVEALRDLWLVPKSGRTSDIWVMGGKILTSLWLPVTAELWLRKATAISGKQDREAAVLFQKVRVRRLYGPLTQGFPVAVDFTQYGRAVVATRDIKAGEVVLKDLPLVHAQTLPSRFVPACSHCTRSLITGPDYFGDDWAVLGPRAKEAVRKHWPDVRPVPCPRCQRETYCSSPCQQAAWEDHHQVLCPSVNPAAGRLYDLRDKDGYGENGQGEWVELWGGHYSPFVLAKIWASILCHVYRLQQQAGNVGQPPTVEQWATAKAPFRRFIAFGTTPATERMPEMLRIFQGVFATPFHGIQYPVTDAEFKGRYYQAACNLQCFSASINPLHRFMTKIKDEVQVLSVLKYLDDSKTPEPYFAGMFPVHACLNHACHNNAEVSNGQLDGQFGIQVTAKTDIKKGGEVFINYIDTALPRMLRRAWLFKSFNFWCHCPRCRFEGDRPTVCTQCSLRAEQGRKFPTCGQCHKAWYCSRQCQQQAWAAGHKAICQTKHSVVASPQEYEVC